MLDMLASTLRMRRLKVGCLPGVLQPRSGKSNQVGGDLLHAEGVAE